MVATESAVLPWSRQTLTGPLADYKSSNAPRVQARADTGARQALNAPETDAGDGGFQPFGKEGFSFFDLVDVINPLQHIPLIGTAYRELTGDTLDPLPRIAGSTLFFGPVGAAFAGANVMLEEMSGQDAGEHIMTALGVGGESVRTAAASAPAVPDHGVSVIATKPAAAGTDAEIAALPGTPAGDMDPVSAWARGELAYRKALATERQFAGNAPAATASAATSAAVSAAAPAPTPAPETAAEPAKLSWAKHPLIDTASLAQGPKGDAAPDLAKFIKAPPAPAMPKHAAQAYGRNGADRHAKASPAAPASAATTGRPTTGATAAPTSTGATAALTSTGATAPGGGWFAANLMHSMEQYQRQQAQADGEPKRRLDRTVN